MTFFVALFMHYFCAGFHLKGGFCNYSVGKPSFFKNQKI